MAFFKILSDDPADFQEDVIAICEHESEEDPCIELILDTGETYIIPVTWLIFEARRHGFACMFDGVTTH